MEAEDLPGQLRTRRGRLKRKKSRNKKRRQKKPPDKERFEGLGIMSGRKTKKPPDKTRGIVDVSYRITVMGKQSGVEANKSKDLNLSSGNLEILIKVKTILKIMVAVIWNAKIKRNSKSFGYAWKNIIWNEILLVFEKVLIWTAELFEEMERILARWKRRNVGILTSDEGDCCRISVAKGR
jgi:hypothetical protein